MPDDMKDRDYFVHLAQDPMNSLDRAFALYITQHLLPARMPGVQVPVLTSLQEVKTMLSEQGMNWTQEWKEQGRQEALDAIRPAVLAQAEQRFGPLSPDVRRWIETIDSTEEIARMIYRMLSAASLVDLGWAAEDAKEPAR